MLDIPVPGCGCRECSDLRLRAGNRTLEKIRENLIARVRAADFPDLHYLRLAVQRRDQSKADAVR